MKSALLIIDVQKGLFDDNPQPFESNDVIDRINRLASRARLHSIPVILIQHEKTESELEYKSTGWQLVSELVVNEADYRVRKTAADSFFKTNLKEILDKENVTNLLISGYATEFCVDTTVRRSAALGYSIQIVSNAHTTHDKKHLTAAQIRTHQNETLSSIQSFGVTIEAMPEQSLIA